MKMNNHDIIKDLIPGYLDNVISTSSRKLIETHLQSCPSCQKYLQAMKAELTTPAQLNLKQINPLKKIKQRTHHKVILGILITIVIMVAGYFGLALYAHSFPAASQQITQSVQKNGQTVTLTFQSDQATAKKLNLMALDQGDNNDEDGFQPVIDVRFSRPLPWNRNKNQQAQVSFTFLSPYQIRGNNGQPYPLEENDIVIINYKNKRQRIKLIDLYQSAETN